MNMDQKKLSELIEARFGKRVALLLDSQTQQLSGDVQERLKEAREEVMEFGEYLLIDSPSRKSERTVLELYTKAKHWGADLIVEIGRAHV